MLSAVARGRALATRLISTVRDTRIMTLLKAVAGG